MNFIKNREVNGKVLYFNKIADDMLKSKNLIKIILDTNSTQYTTSENDDEELIKLLVNYNNIKTTLIQLNNFRAESVILKKKVFETAKKILETTADYLLKNPNSDLAHLLIILSETFKKENTEYFLCEDIKKHKLFKIPLGRIIKTLVPYCLRLFLFLTIVIINYYLLYVKGKVFGKNNLRYLKVIKNLNG